jgi:cytochrome c553
MKWIHLALAASCLAATAARGEEAWSNTQVQRAVHVCASCHGEGGRSSAAVFPSLAGQMPQYVAAQLRDFRGQVRAEIDPQAYMWGVSALLDDATIDGLADYYASQQPAAGRPGNPRLVAAGRKIYEDGIPARGVRACASCHGANAEGASVFPRLAGQHADYAYRQLKGFGTRLRPHGILMRNETANMTDAELRAVAEYVQSR